VTSPLSGSLSPVGWDLLWSICIPNVQIWSVYDYLQRILWKATQIIKILTLSHPLGDLGVTQTHRVHHGKRNDDALLSEICQNRRFWRSASLWAQISGRWERRQQCVYGPLDRGMMQLQLFLWKFSHKETLQQTYVDRSWILGVLLTKTAKSRFVGLTGNTHVCPMDKIPNYARIDIWFK